MERYERVEEFAKIYSRSRNDAGKSQEYLAKALGVSRKTIQNWENGISSPTFFQSVEWFRALSLNPYSYYMRYLYMEDMADLSPESNDKEIEETLIRFIKDSSPREKRDMLYLIMGKHGSSWYCLLQMFVAHAHTSLKSRVTIARTILENYEMEHEVGQLVCGENVEPDVEVLEEAIEAAKKAVIKNEGGYSW